MIRAETLQLRYIREPRFKWALWVLAAAACYGLAYTLAATNANTEFGNWPSNWELPMQEPIDVAFDWVGDTFAWFFNPISDVIAGGVSAINSFLLWLPWPTVLAIVLIGGLKLGGRTLGLLSCGALLFIGLNGFWDSAVLTMSVVVVSVIIGVGLGVPVGILAAFSNRFEALVRPILDTMQVLPAFVYFIPALVLFGVSGAAGVFLTVVYSIPPVIRLTNLGIRQVPQAAVETAQSHGSTPLQTLLHVQLPLAKSSIMMGINQTIMMAVAMVIITALVGVGGLGWDVWLALRQVDAGDGLQSGIAIVLLAIVLDRFSYAFAQSGPKASTPESDDDQSGERSAGDIIRQMPSLGILLMVGVGLLTVLGVLITPLRDIPEELTFSLTDQINMVFDWMAVHIHFATSWSRDILFRELRLRTRQYVLSLASMARTDVGCGGRGLLCRGMAHSPSRCGGPRVRRHWRSLGHHSGHPEPGANGGGVHSGRGGRNWRSRVPEQDV